MLGHRDKLKTGYEWDGLSKKTKGFFNWRPGIRKFLKRQVNKRIRKEKIDAS